MKPITTDTLLKIDEAAQTWREITGTRTDEEWIRFFSAVSLGPEIPAELVKLFEVARGAMIYSFLYYPLATMGAEQCYRVAEAGARTRCKQLGKRPERFELNIEFLSAQNALVDKDRWHSLRSLRNQGSHPERQTLLDPGQAEDALRLTAQFLRDLFG